jgi:nucleotidyltransferase substrate binding protein (TIGR01987 family)
METKDIRWKQRLENYKKALSQLQNAVNLGKRRPLSELEEQGLIQAFEFTHELAWNVMRDYFYYQGDNSITGSRDAIREAFHVGIIEDGDSWMEMIKSRNKTSHTYNNEIASEIVSKILNVYFSLFVAFQNKMEALSVKNH